MFKCLSSTDFTSTLLRALHQSPCSLDANATDYDKVLTVGVHEVIHGLECTKEYSKLADFIVKEISKDPALQQQYSYDKYRAAYDAILEGEWTEKAKD